MNKHSREVKEAKTTGCSGDGAGWKESLEDGRGSLGRRGGAQRKNQLSCENQLSCDKWKEESEVERGTEKLREAVKDPHPQQGGSQAVIG